MLHTKTGNFREARECFAKALEIARQRDDTIVQSVVSLNLAEAWVGAGRLDLADVLCSRALEEAQRRGDHLTAAGALKVRASIERRRGALDKSIATLRIAIYEAEGAEDRLLHAEMLRELGEISRAVGNSGAARSAWREAADAFRLTGAARDLQEVEAQLGSLPA
jgi:tetratricopeptide (TPR) repeat protein